MARVPGRLRVTTVRPSSDRGEKVQESGLPNVFVPRLDHSVGVEALPILGSGKLDLRERRRIAAAALSSQGTAVPDRG